MRKYISIDTNGTNPEAIKHLLPFINRVALDLKGPLIRKRLNEITNSDVDPKLITETFNIVNKREAIDFEIRTTYVEQLMKPEDIHTIITFLKKNHVLVFLVIFVIIASVVTDSFFTFKNITNILRASAVFGIMALGLTVVMIVGEIDISIGAALIMTTVVIAKIGGFTIFIWAILGGLIAGIMGAKHTGRSRGRETGMHFTGY